MALTARHAVAICTGSRTALPELAGLAEARPWTNRQATGSHTVPGRLAIVGGGGVGVEMASAWSGLGSQVTLLAQADGLLPRMEPFAGELIARAFSDAGIDVRIGVTVTGIRRPSGTGPVTLTLEDGGEVEADEVLFATGRQPLTDDIGLDTVGLIPGSWLEVDDGYTGHARMVVDEDHGCLLGVTFVGPGVEELIHSATIAVAGQVPISRLRHAVPCLPSISEVWLRLLEAYQT